VDQGGDELLARLWLSSAGGKVSRCLKPVETGDEFSQGLFPLSGDGQQGKIYIP